MPLSIGVPKEIFPGERRVATVPEVVKKLIKLGFTVNIQSGAGFGAQFSDDAFSSVGATVYDGADKLYASSDIIFKVRAPDFDEVSKLRPGLTLISFIWPAQNSELLKKLSEKKVTVLAMDCVPRISRAQKMDALSSMANIGGYRAVIEAAHHFGRFFTGQITAAGKVPPAKVFVIGAGVAGLAAIGAASGLGAIVRANDTRPEVGDQVKSMGGEFVSVDYVEEGAGVGGYAKTMSEGFLKAQRETFQKQAAEVDIIITTALIPGKPAPKLITEEMVKSMHAGSVIVDMASEQGGNCELTEPGKVVVKHDVTIIGYADLPSRLAKQSSTLYANNLFHLTDDLCKMKDGTIFVNMEDEVLRGTTVIKSGELTWPPPAPKPALTATAVAKTETKIASIKKDSHGKSNALMAPQKLIFIFGVVAVLFWLIGSNAPPAFLGHFTVFVLGCFVGYMVVWNVTPALHTPLMSATNAISSIIAIGALVQIAPPLLEAGVVSVRSTDTIRYLATAGIILTAINMFGGFAVTQRMLAMFKKN